MATTDLLSIATGEIQATNGDIYPGDRFPVDRAVVDQAVVTDHGLVPSRNPGDLAVFCRQIVVEFAQGPRATASAGATG